ncbi:MFS transporter [Streptomyces sp. NPDC050535]|uniref:MFS transporter n=1 Tax=Streptomyces sp. NPDC050535 TaxID=3365626 RepID=UPI00378854B4
MTATAAPTTAAAPRLSRNRDFRLLWIGQALSDFGSSMTYVVLPLVLLAAGYSTTVAATIGTVSLVVGLATRIPAGYLSDRYDQRALMLGCDMVRLLAVGTVAVYVLLRPVPIVLALVMVIVSDAALEVFRPAQNKVVRRIVPTEQLGAAVSLNQARAYGADIAAPAAAGLLLALGPSVPLAVDALTFGCSALCVAAAVRARRAGGGSVSAGASRGKEARAGGARSAGARFTTEFTAGWRYLLRDRFMRWSAVYFAGLNLAFSALAFALILGVGSRPDGAVMVGAAMSAAAVVGLTGSVLTPFVQRRVSLRATLGAAPAAGAALLAVAWISGSLVAFVAGFCALCLLTPVVSARFSTIMAVTVPEEIYGRVSSTSSLVAQILQPCGPLAAGLLLAHLSLSTTAAVLATGLALLAGVPLALPDPSPSNTPESAGSSS